MANTETVIMYKDFRFKEKWNGEYEVEMHQGINKARVINRSGFSLGEKSRLNKLSFVGSSIGADKHEIRYRLKVNGLDAYFKINQTCK